MNSAVNIAEHNPTLEAPVFVVGPLRSGTTLLRLLLAHHSEIGGIGEFEESVSQAVGDDWPDVEEYRRFLSNDRMFSQANYAVDPSLSYEQLVHSFLSQAWARDPQPILSGAVHSRFELLPKLWPKARFIHLLRDPRDVARSCIGMGWVGNAYAGAPYWNRPEWRWNQLRHAVPAEQLHEVRYEELVSDPEGVLSGICEFLGVAYEPGMLAIDQDTTYSRPDASLSEQWRHRLTAREVELVESRCEALMRERGYELVNQHPRPPSRLEVIKLFVQSRLYRWRFHINRWGFSTWLQFNIAKRTGPRFWREAMRTRVNAIRQANLK